jgi:hypothetical protein
MSNFLSNLAARGMGQSQSVRPRVPALFEPDRGSGGQLRARQPSPQEEPSGQDTATGVEEDSARWRARSQSKDGMRSLSLPIVSSQSTRPGWTRTSSLRADNYAASNNSPAARPDRTDSSEEAAKPLTGEFARQPRNPVDAPSVEVSALTHSGPANDSANFDPRTRLHPSIARFSAAVSAAHPRKSVSHAAGREGRTTDADAGNGLESNRQDPEPNQLIQKPQTQKSQFQETQNQKPQSRQPQIQQPLKQPGMTESQFNPPWSTSDGHQPEGSLANVKVDSRRSSQAGDLAAVHAPRPPRPWPATASQSDHAAKPTVRITIGRVDVRALLPEAQAPRASARSARPTLSLDEYLKQRNRGKE